MTRTLLTVLIATLVLSVPAPGAWAQAAPAAKAAPQGAPMDINTASVTDLDTLPGIGRSTAERIVEYRQKNGGFKKIEELMNVKGIGEKSFLRLKPLISVSTKAEKAGGGR